MSASFSFLDVVQVVIEQDHFLGQDNRARLRKRVNCGMFAKRNVTPLPGSKNVHEEIVKKARESF